MKFINLIETSINSLNKANLINKISFLIRKTNNNNYLEIQSDINKLINNNNLILSNKNIFSYYKYIIDSNKDYLIDFLNNNFINNREEVFLYLLENNLYDFNKNILNLSEQETFDILNKTNSLNESLLYEILTISDNQTINDLGIFLKDYKKEFNLDLEQNKSVAHIIIKKEIISWYDILTKNSLLKKENYGYYPAHYIGKNSYENYLKIYNIYKKNDINLLDLKDSFNKNPYINAIRLGNYDIINHSLKEYGKSFFEKTKEALHTSISNGEEKISSLLIDNGADIFENGFLNLNPFWLSIRFYNKNPNIYYKLIDIIKNNKKKYVDILNLENQSKSKRNFLSLGAQYLDLKAIKSLIEIDKPDYLKNFNTIDINHITEIDTTNPFDIFDTNNLVLKELKDEIEIKPNSIYSNIFKSKKSLVLDKFNYFYNEEKIPLKRMEEDSFNVKNFYQLNTLNHETFIADFFIVSLTKYFTKTQGNDFINFVNKNKIKLNKYEIFYVLLNSINTENYTLFNYYSNKITDKELNNILNNKQLNHYQHKKLLTLNPKNLEKFNLKYKNNVFFNELLKNQNFLEFNEDLKNKLFIQKIKEKIDIFYEKEWEDFLRSKIDINTVNYLKNLILSINDKEQLNFIYLCLENKAIKSKLFNDINIIKKFDFLNDFKKEDYIFLLSNLNLNEENEEILFKNNLDYLLLKNNDNKSLLNLLNNGICLRLNNNIILILLQNLLDKTKKENKEEILLQINFLNNPNSYYKNFFQNLNKFEKEKFINIISENLSKENKEKLFIKNFKYSKIKSKASINFLMENLFLISELDLTKRENKKKLYFLFLETDYNINILDKLNFNKEDFLDYLENNYFEFLSFYKYRNSKEKDKNNHFDYLTEEEYKNAIISILTSKKNLINEFNSVEIRNVVKNIFDQNINNLVIKEINKNNYDLFLNLYSVILNKLQFPENFNLFNNNDYTDNKTTISFETKDIIRSEYDSFIKIYQYIPDKNKLLKLLSNYQLPTELIALIEKDIINNKLINNENIKESNKIMKI